MIAALRARPWRYLMSVLVLVLLGVGTYHVHKPLPEGLSYAGDPHPVRDVRFLADLTYVDAAGKRHMEQAIFDELFAMIDSAERFILVDMFLFNPYQGAVREEHRLLSSELTERLIRQKRRHRGMQILVITDPINTLYGGMDAPHLERLEQAGIPVTFTHLPTLRDSNPLYSSIWRTFLAHWGNSSGGWLPNPIGEGRVTLRSYLTLMNFKANHRKVAIADQGEGYTALVTSANPHDASSAHGNVALRFGGPAVADVLETEKAVLAFSDGPVPDVDIPTDSQPGEASLRVLTEGAIERAVLDLAGNAGAGERLDVAVFYLSDRDVVKALLEAHERGVQLRVLLDPNKDAFGRTKNGVPNRQTAHELHAAGVPVRWCDTHGEQCHAKFLLARDGEGRGKLLLGSANFTRRNIEDYNLETNVLLEASMEHQALGNAARWFETRWRNTPERRFSVDYDVYADESPWRLIQYRVMEATGLSTF
jgi:phosphatidylserine/phosphatidylglycerophosphate/cardiolipin synthase-like enzyme